MINSAICAILENKDTEINTQECFDEIFSGISSSYSAAIFLALINLQELCKEDIISGTVSARNAVKKYNLNKDYNTMLENICLNPSNEYLDISFAMDIITSACEIGTVKSYIPNVIHKNKSFETLNTFGINIENLSAENFEKINFIYSYISQDEPYVKYTKELINALPFKSLLDITTCFLNPYNSKNCTLALCNKKQVEKYAAICLSLGYNNSIVFSSDNFPYVSIENETFVSEAWKNKIFSYTLTPQLLEIKQNSLDSIKVENVSHNCEIIKAVFENKLKDSYYDVIVINAGLALYITKKCASLLEGINLAKKIVDEGKALEQINKIKNTFEV